MGLVGLMTERFPRGSRDMQYLGHPVGRVDTEFDEFHRLCGKRVRSAEMTGPDLARLPLLR